MSQISVAIKRDDCSYPINIGYGSAQSAIDAHAAAGGFFVVDKNVAEIYKDIITASQRVFIFEASESTKNIRSVEKILTWLNDGGALRDSSLMVIGGGVTGDTAGFAAALYMRGIKLIQMPTTLLAMVDSSVGGKTGVNMGSIKNNIGAFHQPSSVVIDVNFLESLSETQFLNGLAESIKIACVYRKDFLKMINDNKDKILKRDKQTLLEVVETSCALKAEIVELDEKESGLRKLLNFGHTVGHAIETDSYYSINHGYAVAIGMIYESLFALENRYTDRVTFDLIKDTVLNFGYPSSYCPVDKDRFLNALAKDKKALKGGVSLAIVGASLEGKIINGVDTKGLGRCVFQHKDGYK